MSDISISVDPPNGLQPIEGSTQAPPTQDVTPHEPQKAKLSPGGPQSSVS